ncbi:MAG: hypothetical protein KF754_03240 [Planctomycetes bacterium]|nr:hypothetical protein [Planctomycetota bacterium]
MRIRSSRSLGIVKHTGHAAAVAALFTIGLFAGAIYMFQAGTEQERFEKSAAKYDALVVNAREERSPAKGTSYFINVYFRPAGAQGQEKEFEVPRAAYIQFRDATSVTPVPTQVFFDRDSPYRWHVENAILQDPGDRIYVAWGWTLIGFIMLAVTVASWRKFLRGELQVHAPDEDPPPELIAQMRAAGLPESLIPKPEARPWVPPVGAAPPVGDSPGIAVPPPVSAAPATAAQPPADPKFDLPPWERPRGGDQPH